MLAKEKREKTKDFRKMSMYVYGAPKVGKTTFCADLETTTGKVLFLDCEGGTKHLNAFVNEINTWEEFGSVVRDLISTNHGYSMVVVDSVGALRDILVRKVCDIQRAADPSDPKFGGFSGWGKVSAQWKTQMNALLCGDFGTVFVDHAKTIEVTPDGRTIKTGDKYHGKRELKEVPTLSENARLILTTRCDLILRVYVDENGQRLVSSSNTNESLGGDRSGVLPPVFPLDGAFFVDCFRKNYAKETKSPEGSGRS